MQLEEAGTDRYGLGQSRGCLTVLLEGTFVLAPLSWQRLAFQKLWAHRFVSQHLYQKETSLSNRCSEFHLTGLAWVTCPSLNL